MTTDRCWNCNRKLGKRPALFQLLGEDQTVYLGSECAKQVGAAGRIETGSGTFIKARRMTRDEQREHEVLMSMGRSVAA